MNGNQIIEKTLKINMEANERLPADYKQASELFTSVNLSQIEQMSDHDSDNSKLIQSSTSLIP